MRQDGSEVGRGSCSGDELTRGLTVTGVNRYGINSIVVDSCWVKISEVNTHVLNSDGVNSRRVKSCEVNS